MIPEDLIYSKESVFFFIDESKDISSTDQNGNNIKCTVVGLLCIQGDQLLELEKEFVDSRVVNRLWHEIHFTKASGKYVRIYSDIVEKYMSNSFVTFHSRMFASPDAKERAKNHGGLQKYDEIYLEESYRLIRSVVMKCAAYGYKYFYIVADDYTKGIEDYKLIRERLNSDAEIPELKDDNNLCCTTGNSESCGALQVCDIMTSTLGQFGYKNGGITKGRELLGDMLIRVNNGLNPISYSRYFPMLYSKKIQHFAQKSYSGIFGIKY